MKKSIIRVILFLLLCASAGCVSSKEFSGKIDDLGGDILLIGSIELVPPLKEGEQDLATSLGGKSYENHILFALGDRTFKHRDINLSNLENFVKVELSKQFYIRQKFSKKVYLSAPFLLLGPQEYMYFPGAFSFEVPEGCKVVYLGKIRYSRDVYSAITKVEVINEFDTAQQAAEKRYNEKVEMCRIKMTLLKN